MPKSSVSMENQLKTRNDFTKVDAVLTLTVDGKELPTLATLGKGVEEAFTSIQKAITESYAVVPARV